MNEREYPDDVWHLICDNYDAIKKVKVDIEVSENCIGSRKY